MGINNSFRSTDFIPNPLFQQQTDTPVNSTKTETIDKPESKTFKLITNLSRTAKNISIIAKTAFTALSTKIASLRQKDTAESDLDPNTAALREADGLPPLQDGKEITDVYTHNGKEFGKEVVVRKDMVKDHIYFLNNCIKGLRSELENPRSDKVAIQQKIGLYEKELMIAERLEVDFISSAFLREQLKQNPELSFAEKLNNINQGMLTNCRNHRFIANENDKTEVIGKHLRCGVIAYQGNCHTNLKELSDLQKRLDSPDEKISQKAQQDLREKITNLETKKAKIATSVNITPSERAKLQSLTLAIDEFTQLVTKEKDVVANRRTYLELQMGHLINEQLNNNHTLADSSSKSFSIVHLGLLNPRTNKQDDSGWSHNEANQMQDMHQIFQEFNGKDIIFDGKGPSVDSQGNFHAGGVVKLDKNGEIKKLKLKADFLNTSVQGHTKNDGIQKEINKPVIDKLLKRTQKKLDAELQKKENYNKELIGKYGEAIVLLKKIAADLESGKSNYEIAENIAFALSLLSIPTSFSCLSAKDRTGVVSGSLVNRALAAKMGDDKSTLHVADKKERESIRAKFKDKILSPGGVAVRVVRDNTPNFRFLKARNLLGFSGVAKLRSLGGAAFDTLFPTKSRPSSTSLSDSSNRNSQSSESARSTGSFSRRNSLEPGTEQAQ